MIALTPKQKQVLAHLRDGRANAEIAAELKISRYTVKIHVQRIFRKLGVHKREDLRERAS